MIILEQNDKVLKMYADLECKEEYLETREECNNLDDLLTEALEYYLCNGYEMVDPEDIGALTELPIITDGEYIWILSEWYTEDVLNIMFEGNNQYAWDYVGNME